MLEQLEVATAAQLREAEGELRFWLKELDPDADQRITEPEFEAALGRCGSADNQTQISSVILRDSWTWTPISAPQSPSAKPAR